MSGPQYGIENEPFRRQLSDAAKDMPDLSETEFEKARGVNLLKVRNGYTWFVVRLAGDAGNRLDVLRHVAEAGVNVDFLKLQHEGVSFVVPRESEADCEAALQSAGYEHESAGNMAVLTVHAVNVQDEEGMVARIVSQTIRSGAEILHMSDMHDRVLLLLSESDAQAAAAHLGNLYGAGLE